MDEVCPICEGSGLRVIDRPDGTHVAAECACRVSRRDIRNFEAARIPERYRDCSLENFTTNTGGQNPSFDRALIEARGFVRSHSWTMDGDGLLITGRVGVGKTHLAVGILQALITQGVKGLFVHGGDLLKQVQNSYNRSVETTEQEILKPIFAAQVLVLDELGAARRTDWVSEMIEHILNTRYNDCKATIITTNFQNAPPAATTLGGAALAAGTETLGDRIGEPMRSRLQEMCVLIEMEGQDYREQLKRKQLSEEKRHRMIRRSPILVRPRGRAVDVEPGAEGELRGPVPDAGGGFGCLLNRSGRRAVFRQRPLPLPCLLW